MKKKRTFLSDILLGDCTLLCGWLNGNHSSCLHLAVEHSLEDLKTMNQ